MNHLDEIRPIIEAVFHQRLEEIVACEAVSELGSKQRASRPRLLLLCQPMSSTASRGASASLAIATIEKNKQQAKIRQVFVVERLADVQHDGNFDATFNFGASGMLSVGFESHIQREMFVAAVLRTRDALRGGKGKRVGSAGARLASGSSRGAGGVGGGAGGAAGGGDTYIRGILTDAVGAEAEADAASRVRKLRQEKRRVFTSAEERHLLAHMDGSSGFDDIRQFQQSLLGRQKDAELVLLDELLTSKRTWDDVKVQVHNLVQDVEEVEKRIQDYSSHLLSKKQTVQLIEHSNNTLQRKQQNLEELHAMMLKLSDQLSLSAQTAALLEKLRKVPDSGLIAFFSDGRNAQDLSEAMRHMHAVLHSPKLQTDFPIAAVRERRQFFLSQRRMVAQRSQSYLFSTIESLEAQYLADKSRYSRNAVLVWRLHTELSRKLLNVRDIIEALSHIDMEGFVSTLRKYRTSMQTVYALEISRFFKCLRRQVRRLDAWKGGFQLGTSQSKKEALSVRMESAQAGETPRVWRQSPLPSPALTPRLMRGMSPAAVSTPRGRAGFSEDDDDGLGSTAGTRSDSKHQMLTVEFPFPEHVSDIDLYANPDTLRRLDARAASPASVGSSLRSLTAVGDSSGTGTGGTVKPDLALAIALQSFVGVVLEEEYVLRACFGAYKPSAGPVSADAEDAVRDELSRHPSSIVGFEAASTINPPAATGGSEEGGGQKNEAEGNSHTPSTSPAEAAELLRDSLLELFAGEKVCPTAVAQAQGSSLLLQPLQAGGGRPTHERSASDIGLPPMYPMAAGPGRGLGGGGGGRNIGTLLNTYTQDLGSAAGGGLRRFASTSDLDYTDGGAEGKDTHSEAAIAARRAMRNNYLALQLAEFFLFVMEKCDRIYSIPAMCMVKAYRCGKLRSTTSSFCKAALQEVESIVAGSMMQFVAEQTESISVCRTKYLIRPTALLHCFTKMPAFFLRMEAVYNALSEDVVDRTEYGSIASSLVDQSFDALDQVTNIKTTGSSSKGKKLKLNELLLQKVNTAFGDGGFDMNSMKQGSIQQYRHHAFFCAFCATLPSDSYAAELLQDHFESSKTKRDRYEELYLTRVILTNDFPVFGLYALSAEDLSNVYSKEELKHHRFFALETVKKIVDKVDKEIHSGVKSSAARMKRHFLRDVDAGSSEESFHRTLLQRTWQHFAKLLLQKFDFLMQLLQWPVYEGLRPDITRAEVEKVLASY